MVRHPCITSAHPKQLPNPADHPLAPNLDRPLIVPPPYTAEELERGERYAEHLRQIINPPDTWAEYRSWGQQKAVGLSGRSICVGLRVIQAATVVGEWLADLIGITDSAYQNVVDAYERDQRQLARQGQLEEQHPSSSQSVAPSDPTDIPIDAEIAQLPSTSVSST